MACATGSDPFPGANRPGARGRARAGFTLLELLVVLAILGLLAVVATPQVLKYLGSARHETARVQVQNLGTALDLYRFETGRYPTTQEGLQALVAAPPGVARWAGPYLKTKESLVDPWGRPYHYRSPGEHGPYDLASLGADGQPGGDGEDRDETSW
ncbi:type II secretion system major pseudopilin GspG [Azospirillum sp. ST 5-10]|uniref:type II secretion system major pseudopilin GspG n=1 Tax=unclassified Azospirillum TaxID=2630922 RepID=UPI003F49ED32